MELSKTSNPSEFGSLSKKLAQDEVHRIREEMRKNLEARQAALRKMKPLNDSAASQKRSSRLHNDSPLDSQFNHSNTSEAPQAQPPERKESFFASSLSSIGRAAQFNRKTLNTDPHDLSMSKGTSKGGKSSKGLSLQAQVGLDPQKAKEQMEDLREKADRSAKKRPITKMERRWVVATRINFVVDAIASIYFFYLGWLLHENDLETDPIAWQMSFGAVIIFLFLKDAQIYMQQIQWLQPWLLFTVPLLLGHIYGASRYFFWILQDDWPCFSGQGNYSEGGDTTFAMCYNGRLLCGFTSGALYLTASCFILWRWVVFQKNCMRQRGEVADELNIEQLLANVETNMAEAGQDYQAEEVEEEDLISAAKAKAAAAFAAKHGRIAGMPVRARKVGKHDHTASSLEDSAGVPVKKKKVSKGIMPTIRRSQTVNPSNSAHFQNSLVTRVQSREGTREDESSDAQAILHAAPFTAAHGAGPNN